MWESDQKIGHLNLAKNFEGKEAKLKINRLRMIHEPVKIEFFIYSWIFDAYAQNSNRFINSA